MRADDYAIEAPYAGNGYWIYGSDGDAWMPSTPPVPREGIVALISKLSPNLKLPYYIAKKHMQR